MVVLEMWRAKEVQKRIKVSSDSGRVETRLSKAETSGQSDQRGGGKREMKEVEDGRH